VPAFFRGYPFCLRPNKNGDKVLCLHEDKGVLLEGTARSGQPFFAANGELSAETNRILQFLLQVDNNQAATDRVFDAMAKEDLIEPWKIRLLVDKEEKFLEGFFRVNETKFNTLAKAAVSRLHTAQAFGPAYCQLLSMQHTAMLGVLADAHAKAKAAPKVAIPTAGAGEIDFSFLQSHSPDKK
jgi:hypothetical protein